MKKGQIGDLAFSVTFVVLIILITIALVSGNYLFFKDGFDYRKTESEILNYKVSKCIQENPEIKNEEILKTCSLNKEVIEKNFIIIVKTENSILAKLGKGDETLCALSEKNEEFPVCTTSIVKTNNGEYIVITGSSQNSREEIAA